MTILAYLIVEDFETAIDVNVNAYIPNTYIKHEEQRLEFYKKISLISNEHDFNDVRKRLKTDLALCPRPCKIFWMWRC